VAKLRVVIMTVYGDWKPGEHAILEEEEARRGELEGWARILDSPSRSRGTGAWTSQGRLETKGD